MASGNVWENTTPNCISVKPVECLWLPSKNPGNCSLAKGADNHKSTELQDKVMKPVITGMRKMFFL